MITEEQRVLLNSLILEMDEELDIDEELGKSLGMSVIDPDKELERLLVEIERLLVEIKPLIKNHKT